MRFLVLASLALCGRAHSRAQAVPAASQGPPPAASATFTSLEGRFAIALPKDFSGIRGVTFDTPKGNVNTGEVYTWRSAEAQYEVGYMDKGKTPLASGDTRELMRTMNARAVAQAASQGGKVVADGEVTASGLPGHEVRVEYPEWYSVSRVVAAGDRIYYIGVAFKKDAEALAAAGRILDSFRALSAAEVEAVVSRSVEAATPAPLPQAPAAARPKSDAEDEGLRGRVKTVLTESEDLAGTWSAQGRRPSSMQYFDERGNLVKWVSYNGRGIPDSVAVYGYLDGRRVLHTRSVWHGDGPARMVGTAAPGPAEGPDPRYSHMLKFKYDGAGRLREQTWFRNDGLRLQRYVYRYKGGRKEELVYFANGTLGRKHLYTLDDKGNAVGEVVYETGETAPSGRYSYSHEFDAHGNWTRRVSSQWGTKDGKQGYQPHRVYYRTITYY